jgi:hypothetical protein
MAEMRILGAAFGVRVPSVLTLNSITESDWFTHQEMLRFNHADASSNVLGFASTRRNSNGAVAMSGDLMTVEFTVTQAATVARFELENAILSTPTTLENNVAFTLSAVVEHTSDADENRIAEFALHQNSPNPFNPTTSISYEIDKPGFVRLSVFNLIGQEVAILVNGNQTAGRQTANFDAADLSSGLYFYKLTTGGQTAIRKMTLVK